MARTEQNAVFSLIPDVKVNTIDDQKIWTWRPCSGDLHLPLPVQCMLPGMCHRSPLLNARASHNQSLYNSNTTYTQQRKRHRAPNSCKGSL